jgi:YD repeat-containing protein
MRLISLLAASAFLLNLLACRHGGSQKAAVSAGFFQQVDYDSRERLLTIHFRDGSVYAYQNVPARIFDQLVRSSEPGDFFNDEIRDQYSFELLHVRTALGIPQVQTRVAENAQHEIPCMDPGDASKKPIKSVILDFAAYDAGHHCMILYFDRGGIYQYGNVPPEIFNSLLHTPHADKFFNREIWGKYPARRAQRP